MTSINTINQSIALSTYKCTELSTTTKMRLEALGIDPSSVTSEAQAQILIAQAEAAQSQNNSGQQQGGGSSQQELMLKAKELAKELKVNVSQTDNLNDITGKIAEKIQILGENPNNSKQVQQYQSRLAEIVNKAQTIKNTQQNIFNTMNMISISNKFALGL